MLTVNELAKRSSMSAHTVRYYIRAGLVTPASTQENNYRLFNSDAVKRLKFIRTARMLGFTLSDIQQIFAQVGAGESPCANVRVLIRERLLDVEEKLRDMQQLHQRIAQALESWDALPDQQPNGGGICSLIESVDPANQAT